MAQQILPMINVQKFYAAKLLTDADGKVSYDTPRYLEGIKELGIKPKESSESYYQEGIKVLEEFSLSDIDVTLNLTDLSDEDEAYCLGHQLSSEGGIIKNTNDVAPEMAFLFKSNKAKGVDRYVALYAGVMNEPDFNVKSKEGKVNYQSMKIAASFRPLSNGLWSYRVDTDSPGVGDVIENFFKQVIVPTPKPAE